MTNIKKIMIKKWIDSLNLYNYSFITIGRFIEILSAYNPDYKINVYDEDNELCIEIYEERLETEEEYQKRMDKIKKTQAEDKKYKLKDKENIIKRIKEECKTLKIKEKDIFG